MGIIGSYVMWTLPLCDGNSNRKARWVNCPKCRQAPARATAQKTHRDVPTASKESARVSSVPPAIQEFDAAVHHQEIAQVAYRNWLERSHLPGSPEEDWLKAVNEVRAKYTR